MGIDIISKYFILFMMYSCAGWLMETTWVSINNKKIVDRGFLIGPYCPIYGCGALVIILFLNKFAFNPILLFLITFFVCGSLEYFTSWAMEKVFKARWWDYSDRKFNINGRVCLRNLIAFGIMGVAVTYFINPYFEKWVGYLSYENTRSLGIILWTIFVIDCVLSTVVVYGFRTTTEKVNKEGMADNTEQITKMVREQLSERSIFHRRFINAYPRLEAIKIKMQEIKNRIEDVTIEAKDAVVDRVSDAKNAVTEKVNDTKDMVTEKVNEAKAIVTEKVNGAKNIVSGKTVIIKNSIESGTKRAKIQIRLGKRYLKKSYKRFYRKKN